MDEEPVRMITATLGQLAELVGGDLVGDPDLVITGAATMSDALPGQISFVDHPKLRAQLARTTASAVLVPCGWEAVESPAIRVPMVRAAFAAVVSHFRPPFHSPNVGISPAARIDATAQLESGVQIHPLAVIGPEVRIGRGSIIHSHVTLMGRCRIGRDVTIFPGCVLYRDTVIGAYGFGYETIDGRHLRGDQLGYVVLEDDVEVGANTTIDRGTYGATVIGEGTKIDNQVMIAHNCRLGKHNLICSQVGIAGSSATGDYVVMAGQVGVPDHVRIGHRAVLGAKAGVMRDVPDDTTVIGIPATPEREQMAIQAALAKLPEMRRQLRDLKRHVDQLAALVTPQAPALPAVESPTGEHEAA
jgi:UDP-3-O-[3-hydroxymyristoyl] glucosamine N-acyltransferase